MSYNKSYQHVERVGKDEVEGILHGTCYVMPKLDGTNGVVWYDGNTIHCGSRNREVSVNNDNQGFMNYIIKDQRFWDFFKRHPDLTLYGEWLCVSGDTLIRKTSAGKNGVYMTIRQMYEYMNTNLPDRDQSWWQKNGFPQIFSLYKDEDVLKPNRIKNIVFSGNKVVYEVKTRKGFTIKTTKEHKFFTIWV